VYEFTHQLHCAELLELGPQVRHVSEEELVGLNGYNPAHPAGQKSWDEDAAVPWAWGMGSGHGGWA
jgi:hypothetical protein